MVLLGVLWVLQPNEMRDQTILSFLSENLQIWIKLAG